jgi:biopolymer transport protein ExbD
MASISCEISKGRRRMVNAELPLLPFVDFLLCLVAFLLITAVWSAANRLAANAEVPSGDGTPPSAPPKQLHITIGDRTFELAWRQSGTVLSTHSVPRQASLDTSSQPRYPALAQQLEEEWRTHAIHTSPSDPRQDTAIVHAPNSLPFEDLAAVLDALHAPQRLLGASLIPSFAVSFVTD